MARGIKRTPDWVRTSARLMVKYGRLAHRDSGAFVEVEDGPPALWRLRRCDNDHRAHEMRIPAIGDEHCDRRVDIIIKELKRVSP